MARVTFGVAARADPSDAVESRCPGRRCVSQSVLGFGEAPAIIKVRFFFLCLGIGGTFLFFGIAIAVRL
jgi:hypothetical protein